LLKIFSSFLEATNLYSEVMLNSYFLYLFQPAKQFSGVTSVHAESSKSELLGTINETQIFTDL